MRVEHGVVHKRRGAPGFGIRESGLVAVPVNAACPLADSLREDVYDVLNVSCSDRFVQRNTDRAIGHVTEIDSRGERFLSQQRSAFGPWSRQGETQGVEILRGGLDRKSGV